jgi:rare lipoprotein A
MIGKTLKNSLFALGVLGLMGAVTELEPATPCARAERDNCFVGVASWYGPGFHGKRTANGEKFNKNALTAAHNTLPLDSKVRVVNIATGKEVTVRINDRGPGYGRSIDLSEAAARKLGMRHKGLARVVVHKLNDNDQQQDSGDVSDKG